MRTKLLAVFLAIMAAMLTFSAIAAAAPSGGVAPQATSSAILGPSYISALVGAMISIGVVVASVQIFKDHRRLQFVKPYLPQVAAILGLAASVATTYALGGHNAALLIINGFLGAFLPKPAHQYLMQGGKPVGTVLSSIGHYIGQNPTDAELAVQNAIAKLPPIPNAKSMDLNTIVSLSNRWEAALKEAQGSAAGSTGGAPSPSGTSGSS